LNETELRGLRRGQSLRVADQVPSHTIQGHRLAGRDCEFRRVVESRGKVYACIAVPDYVTDQTHAGDMKKPWITHLRPGEVELR